MARPTVTVRDATPDDLPDLVAMWGELRAAYGRVDRSLPQPTEAGVLSRLHEAALDPRLRVVVATVGSEVAGMAVLSQEYAGPLLEQGTVQVHYVHVREPHRRRGVGAALMTAAACFAEERGVEHVVANVVPQLRDAQRFYARLGFAPQVVRRVAQVSVLRRRLAAERAAHGLPPAVDGLTLRRRAARARGRVRAALSGPALER